MSNFQQLQTISLSLIQKKQAQLFCFFILSIISILQPIQPGICIIQGNSLTGTLGSQATSDLANVAFQVEEISDDGLPAKYEQELDEPSEPVEAYAGVPANVKMIGRSTWTMENLHFSDHYGHAALLFGLRFWLRCLVSRRANHDFVDVYWDQRELAASLVDPCDLFVVEKFQQLKFQVVVEVVHVKVVEVEKIDQVELEWRCGELMMVP